MIFIKRSYHNYAPDQSTLSFVYLAFFIKNIKLIYRFYVSRGTVLLSAMVLFARQLACNKNIGRVVVWVVLFWPLPGFVHAAYVDLPRNADGWTVFTPSADSTIVYVSSSGNDSTCKGYLPNNAAVGSDPFNPVSAIPCATIATAFAKTHNNMPDWILIKRGDTFTQRIGSSVRTGRSATEPFVYGAYGNTGVSPILKVGSNSGVDWESYIKWVAVSGIDFYAHTRNPDGGEYIDATGNDGIFIYTPPVGVSTTEGILVEGCKFRYFKNNLNLAGRKGKAYNYTIRRNLIEYSYNTGGMSSGMYVQDINGLIVEENIFNHNGWLIQSYDSGTVGGQATIFNHNFYSTDNLDMKLRSNTFLMASSNSSKIKSYATPVTGLEVVNNLYIGGEISISLGASDLHTFYSIVSPIVTDNVSLHAGLGNPTNRRVAYFFYNFNLDGGTLSNNYMLHQPDSSINNDPRFLHFQYSMRDVIVNNNILYNVNNVIPVLIAANDTGGPARSGIVIRDNSFDTQNAYIVNASTVPDVAGFSFATNKYNTTKTPNTWFNVNKAVLSDAQWASPTSDTSTHATASYPDPARDVTTYMTTLGESATIEAFIAKCRTQDRYTWDKRFTAQQVNAWIKEGFGKSGGVQIPVGFNYVQ